MPLAPIKNILRFSHNKWDKHLISSKKDLSRVPIFVSHNGILDLELQTILFDIDQSKSDLAKIYKARYDLAIKLLVSRISEDPRASLKM